MTTGDIQAHLLEIYGTEISRETISKITDQIVEDMNSWQRRPLDRLYPVLLIDAIVIKVRDRRQPPMTITTAYTKNRTVPEAARPDPCGAKQVGRSLTDRALPLG